MKIDALIVIPIYFTAMQSIANAQTPEVSENEFHVALNTLQGCYSEGIALLVSSNLSVDSSAQEVVSFCQPEIIELSKKRCNFIFESDSIAQSIYRHASNPEALCREMNEADGIEAVRNIAFKEIARGRYSNEEGKPEH